MNEPGDVIRLKSGRTYLYCGKYTEGCLYVLVGLPHMPISEAIVIHNLYTVSKKRKQNYGLVSAKPNLSGTKVFTLDLSGHQNLLKSIWRMEKCQ